jgi:uncharacterized protein with FMN-binding domain
MKKIVLWLMSTVTVVVLLFGYHTSLEGTGVSATPPAAISGSTTGTPSSDAGTGSSNSSGGSGAGSGSGSDSSGASGSGSSDGSSGSSAKSSGSSSSSATVTGDVAQTEWGPVEVKLTIEDGKITAVDVPEYPNGNGRDYEINSYALPQLVQETLSAQSAQIDMVSGATVTSDGYLQSLQSALDKADL